MAVTLETGVQSVLRSRSSETSLSHLDAVVIPWRRSCNEPASVLGDLNRDELRSGSESSRTFIQEAGVHVLLEN